jgi:hypothetical protein
MWPNYFYASQQIETGIRQAQQFNRTFSSHLGGIHVCTYVFSLYEVHSLLLFPFSPFSCVAGKYPLTLFSFPSQNYLL